MSDVNYRIRKLEANQHVRGKVVHINSLKVYVEREQRVNKLTVIAEETEVQDPLVIIGNAPGRPEKSLTEVLDRFQDVLSDIPDCILDPYPRDRESHLPSTMPDKLLSGKNLQYLNNKCSTSAWSAQCLSPMVHKSVCRLLKIKIQ